MTTKEDLTVAVGHSVDVDRWRVDREVLISQVAPRFARVESYRHACELLAGLMSDLPKSWAQDAARLAEAGVSDDTEFATKPTLGKQLIDRALDVDVIRHLDHEHRAARRHLRREFTVP